jgi:hypothetical protein
MVAAMRGSATGRAVLALCGCNGCGEVACDDGPRGVADTGPRRSEFSAQQSADDHPGEGV